MTDKQIIDDVDVSGCKHIDADCFNCEIFAEVCHEVFPNCYYKQLKRKEQECEEYKKKLDNIQDSCPEEVCRNGAYDEFKMPLDENSIILDIINKADCRQSAESFCVAKHADTFNADNQAVKDGE